MELWTRQQSVLIETFQRLDMSNNFREISNKRPESYNSESEYY